MSTSRHFKNDAPPYKTANVQEELLASLNRINTYNPPVQTCSTGWSFSGLYHGPTSIAFLFLRLASLYPELEFKGQSLKDWAQAYLNLGAHEKPMRVDPNHCGVANETLAQLALQAVLLKDSSLVQKLCSYTKLIHSNETSGSNEWLYGRSGYLYFLRLVRTVFDKPSYPTIYQLVQHTIQTTVSQILESPQPWTWHGKEYLGAVHGTIGIVCQLVLSWPSCASSLSPLLQSLLDTQYHSGNLPSSTPISADRDRLVQFCHGGPGFIICLRSLRSYFPDLESRIDNAIALAEADIWQRGLLTKVPCLCHGIASNALALSSEQQFNHFLSWMSTSSLEKHHWLDDAGHTDTFPALYTGEAGRAWVWAVADKGLPKTCIGFNDV